MQHCFQELNLKDLKVDSTCSRSWECPPLPFYWISKRPSKHHGTALSLAKILSFKYFCESYLLKQVKRAHLHFHCKALSITTTNHINLAPSWNFFRQPFIFTAKHCEGRRALWPRFHAEEDIGGYPIPQYRKKKWQIPKYLVKNCLYTDTAYFNHASI